MKEIIAQRVKRTIFKNLQAYFYAKPALVNQVYLPLISKT